MGIIPSGLPPGLWRLLAVRIAGQPSARYPQLCHATTCQSVRLPLPLEEGHSRAGLLPTIPDNVIGFGPNFVEHRLASMP